MQQKSEMQQGWDFATQIMGADLAAHMGMEYVSAVDAAIKQLEENINKHNYRNLGIKQLQGFIWKSGAPVHLMWMPLQLILHIERRSFIVR